MINHTLLAKIIELHSNNKMVLQTDTCKMCKSNSDNIKDINVNQLILHNLHTQPVKTENENENIKKNMQQNTQKNEKILKEKDNKVCCCYNKQSKDMRCCGLCYTFCYVPNKDDQCYMCLNTFEEYYTSGYFITTCGYGKTDDECENCVPTTLCLPIKLPIFFTCLLGSIFNNCINYCRVTNANYLF